MTSTPYDNKILLVNWKGITTPGKTPAETAVLFREKMPNVAGIMLKTSNGVSWQGHLGHDNDLKAITGTTRINAWVAAFAAAGLEVHVWGVPRAKRPEDIPNEAEKFAKAALLPGVKSLLLDVEHGDFYWQGRTQDEARLMASHIRNQVGPEVHIGFVSDGRFNRPFNFYVDPWMPFMDSIHPMVYPITFGRHWPIERHLSEAFNVFAQYDKPIIPMLQSCAEGDRPTPDEITRQGIIAFSMGAAGISFFRLGSDRWKIDNRPHMGDPEYAAVAAIMPPQVDITNSYTWNDLFNAVETVAIREGGDNNTWNQWFNTAGVWLKFHPSARTKPYDGPPIDGWPIAMHIRQQILDLLQLDTTELHHITVNAQGEHEREEQEEAALLRPQRGSIIGIHGAPGHEAPKAGTWEHWIELIKEMGVHWYKQCDNGDPNDLGPSSVFAWVKRLKAEGLEPIVRYQMSEQFPDSLSDHYFEKMRKYAAEGIVWAEIGNEPNLDIEWKSAWRDQKRVSHRRPEAIQRVAETWVRDAQRALDAGVRPAFYAFAPTDWRGGSHPDYSSVFFTHKVIAYLAAHHHAETIDIFQRGGWIAVHAATYEQPVDFAPKQANMPVWDMTLRSYEIVVDAFHESFGADLNLDTIPIMSTEGGVFTPESTSMTGHDKLKTDAEHAQRVVEMFTWLERNSPLQAMCPWCISVGELIGHFNHQFRHDGWIVQENNDLVPRPVYEALRQLRFDQEREVEAVDPAHAMIKLAVPFMSQFDATANTHNADCGPTCLAMLLNIDKDTDGVRRTWTRCMRATRHCRAKALRISPLSPICTA